MPIGVGAGIALGSLASGLLGGASSTAGALLSYQQQKKLASYNAKLNYEYAEKSARNQPIWNRAGLESAGYNPMLAVQNSTSGANSSWTSAQSANAPDIAGGISSGIANAQSFQRLKNETIVADQTSKKLESEGENLNADTANKLEENKYIGEKRKKEIANIQADTLEKEAQIDNMNKRLELDRYINDSGLATTRRGQNLVYNASTYSALSPR